MSRDDKRRFSKDQMIEMLEKRIMLMEDRLGFDESDGSAQVKGRSPEWQQAYGEFRAYCDLRENIIAGDHNWVRSNGTCLMWTDDDGMEHPGMPPREVTA